MQKKLETTEKVGAKEIKIEGLEDGYRVTVRADEE